LLIFSFYNPFSNDITLKRTRRNNMRKIVSSIKKYIKIFFDYLKKESLKQNSAILDKIKKGGYV